MTRRKSRTLGAANSWARRSRSWGSAVLSDTGLGLSARLLGLALVVRADRLGLIQDVSDLSERLQLPQSELATAWEQLAAGKWLDDTLEGWQLAMPGGWRTKVPVMLDSSERAA